MQPATELEISDSHDSLRSQPPRDFVRSSASEAVFATGAQQTTRQSNLRKYRPFLPTSPARDRLNAGCRQRGAPTEQDRTGNSVGYTGFPYRLWASVRLGWQSHADRFQSAPLVAVRSIVPSSLHERKQAASLQSCRSHHTQTDFTTHL